MANITHFKIVHFLFFSPVGASACVLNNYKAVRGKCHFLLDYTVSLAKVIHSEQVIVPYIKQPRRRGCFKHSREHNPDPVQFMETLPQNL